MERQTGVIIVAGGGGSRMPQELLRHERRKNIDDQIEAFRRQRKMRGALRNGVGQVLILTLLSFGLAVAVSRRAITPLQTV